MGQQRTMEWDAGPAGLEQVWRCGCWDCAAHRRYVLRKVALLVVLLGLSCGWAIETGMRQGPLGGEAVTVGEVGGVPWI